LLSGTPAIDTSDESKSSRQSRIMRVTSAATRTPATRDAIMSEPPISRGFRARQRPDVDPRRLPPGQHVTTDFPVLSTGPTPRVRLETWNLAVQDGGSLLAKWNWAQFAALPQTTVTIDTLIAAAGLSKPPAPFAMAHCDGGYTTNLPVADLLHANAMVATHYDGRPLAPEHGGPARLLVPHLYFWKSAKWVRRVRFVEEDEPGFWESLGYHMYGDPWREQRYAGD
jgi:DMSO/TMAO reductase YedYZ molybdopterin-dependent catalytic subunit